ncbi:MAG TPA: hypothetical protein PK355_06450, partial [Chitinophagales bacterium]|nr:hypothetical protein [Chitinophagales bacterium]
YYVNVDSFAKTYYNYSNRILHKKETQPYGWAIATICKTASAKIAAYTIKVKSKIVTFSLFIFLFSYK